MHLVESPLELRTGKSMRMSKKAFSELQQQMQAYQHEKYPELENSIVVLWGQKKIVNTKDAEYLVKQAKGFTNKEIAGQKLEEVLGQSNNLEDLRMLLKAECMEIYERNGEATGIWFNNRKFRFKTVGIEKERIQKLKEPEKTKNHEEQLPLAKNLIDNDAEMESSVDDVIINTAGVADIDAVTLPSNITTQNDASAEPNEVEISGQQQELTQEEIEMQELQQLRDNPTQAFITRARILAQILINQKQIGL